MEIQAAVGFKTVGSNKLTDGNLSKVFLHTPGFIFHAESRSHVDNTFCNTYLSTAYVTTH